MGIVALMDRITELVTATVPRQRPNDSFHAIDDHGNGVRLEAVAPRTDRCFDVGTIALPVDDGEAGAQDCGTLRVRAVLALRIGYRLDDGQDRRLLDGLVAEDVRRILTSLLKPAAWDASTTGIISIVPPEQAPTTELLDGGGLIVSLPLTVLYREEA